MNKPYLSIIACTALLVSGPSLAQEMSEYDRSGFYAGVVGLGAIETFDFGGFSNGGGFNIRGGYRVSDHLAVEMQFEYVDGFSGFGVDLEAWNLMANGKVFLLTGRSQPYGLFGIGVFEGKASAGGLSIDDTDFAIRVGGGIDFYVNDNIVLGPEIAWVKPTGNMEDFSYLTIGAGLQYRF